MGSTISPENLKLESKTKARNIHSRIFYLLFQGSRLGFKLEFRLGLYLRLVSE